VTRIGVDVGGTFTDLVLVDEATGRVAVGKVPSTPDDPAVGAVAGIDELCANGVRGALYCHEIIRVPPGRAPELLDAIRATGESLYEVEGLELVGAFRTVMRADDECIVLWACPNWNAWGEFEQAWHGDGELAGWGKGLIDFGATWQRTVLVDAELSPMRIGRQPSVEDRRPLDQV